MMSISVQCHKRQARWIVVSAACLLFASIMLSWAFSVRDQREAFISRAQNFEELTSLFQQYIMDCGSYSGALLNTPPDTGQVSVVPYFSSLGAIGLLAESDEATLHQRLMIVEDYIQWYGSHLNIYSDDSSFSGSIMDYSYSYDRGYLKDEKSEKPDSEDSYSATYLLLIYEYLINGGDPSFIIKHQDEVLSVASSILTLIKNNSLSSVSEDNHTQYFMDNIEVLAAISIFPDIVTYLYDSDIQVDLSDSWSYLSNEFSNLAVGLERSTITILWNEGASVWNVGINGDGTVIEFDGWDDFYPSAVVQLAPASYKKYLPDCSLLNHDDLLYEKFCSHYEWQELSHIDDGSASFYWSIICYAAASLGDIDKTEQYLNTLYEKLQADGFSYPFYIADAGWAARAASECMQICIKAADAVDPFGIIRLLP